ncbi:MAG TPA: VOC family protein [Solirubrobacteraceae bacterium]|nr:VOC family protein [Solirubrobacteraceae bacterium]
MAERSEYAPGTFSWADLATTDQPAAKAFYSALFGWEAEDMPVGDGVSYSMMRIDGKSVAAIAPQPQPQRDAGAPPAWQSYVTVADADATVARAKELGGTAHTEAFDVMEAGRMAVLQDPHGAYFMVWQPRQHIGASLVASPGTLTWNELASPDLDESQAFYGGLFGWTFSPLQGSPEPYLVIENAERGNGGIRPLAPPGMPPHWLVYFGVEDLDASLAKLAELGGAKVSDPIDIQVGKIAVVRDPQGAHFAFYCGEFTP